MPEKEQLQSLEQLLSQIGTITDSYEKMASATGENFNIFSILKMETKEEQTHSRFIAELLNPKGRHGMGAEFLSLFLNTVVSEIADKENLDVANEEQSVHNRMQVLVQKSNLSKAIVNTEYHIASVDYEAKTGGNIDILIRLKGVGNIMIENKVYAAEQKHQLQRYQNFDPNGVVLFLTRFGNDSEYHREFANYIPISYQDTLCNWLEACIQLASTKAILRESLVQYLHLCKKLTHQNKAKIMTQAIAEKIIETANNREAFKAVVRAQNEVRKHFIKNKVLPRIREALRGVNTSKSYQCEFSLNEDAFLNYNKEWKSFKISAPVLPKGTKIGFEHGVPKNNGYKNFVFGIYGNNEVSQREDLVEFYKKELDQNNLRTKSNHAWISQAKYEGYSEWNNWDTLFSLDSDAFQEDFQNKVELLLDVSEEKNFNQ